jgi:hypothetical protein
MFRAEMNQRREVAAGTKCERRESYEGGWQQPVRTLNGIVVENTGQWARKCVFCRAGKDRIVPEG